MGVSGALGTGVDGVRSAQPVRALTMNRRRAWHVSPSANRASIQQHGLDWRRMATTGIALPPMEGRVAEPELDAVFLCGSLDDVEFFVGFGSHPAVDIWKVDTEGLAIEDGPDGWLLHRAPIPTTRVSLVAADRDANERRLSTAMLSFVSRDLSVDQMTSVAGITPDDAGSMTGDSFGLQTQELCAFWLLEGSDRYRSLGEQVTELLARVRRAEQGLARLGAMCDRAAFHAYTSGAGQGLSNADLDPDALELLARVNAVAERA